MAEWRKTGLAAFDRLPGKPGALYCGHATWRNTICAGDTLGVPAPGMPGHRGLRPERPAGAAGQAKACAGGPDAGDDTGSYRNLGTGIGARTGAIGEPGACAVAPP
jgi:hypothetical protein